MPTENELEELTNDFLDGTMRVKGAGINGREAEQVKELGIMAVSSGTDRISGKDILQDRYFGNS